LTTLESLAEGATGRHSGEPASSRQAAPAGKPDDDGRAGSKVSEEVGESVRGAVLNEWLGSPSVLAWARVQPRLSHVDLRPYLFVSRDRKDYFSAVSALGHLATIVEQLLGPRLSVQALSHELKRLVVSEASQVFEAIRIRIVGEGSLETEPPGIAGLVLLVKTHPSLQQDLVGFLELLPADRLGPWVVKGWTGVITEVAVQERFDRLLKTWAMTTNENVALRTAADGVVRAQRANR